MNSGLILPQFRKATGPSQTVGLVTDYTREINIIPNMWGRINAMGFMGGEGIATTTAIIDQVENTLSILPNVARGGPASAAAAEVVKQLPIIVPHFPHNDLLTPQDLQDRRAPGSQGADTATRNLQVKMENMRRKHAQTLEHLRMGALKGLVVTGNGNTVFDAFTEFGITEEVIDFVFSVATTEIMPVISSLWRHMENEAKMGGTIDQIHVFCSPGWFDSLVTHATVKDAFSQFNATNQIAAMAADRTAGQVGGLQPLQNTMRRAFVYGGVVFEEYNGVVTLPDGTTEKFIPDDEARAFLPNVPDLFRTFYSPANKMQHVNTIGSPLYMFAFEDPKGNGTELESESNVLPICTRPATLVKLTKS